MNVGHNAGLIYKVDLLQFPNYRIKKDQTVHRDGNVSKDSYRRHKKPPLIPQEIPEEIFFTEATIDALLRGTPASLNALDGLLSVDQSWLMGEAARNLGSRFP